MQKSRLNRLRLRLSFRGMLILTLALAFLPIAVAYATIVGTRHDLSAGGPGPVKAASAAMTEKCVFCHTPHSKDTTYPLWNHSLSSATYTVSVAGNPEVSAAYISRPSQPDGGSKLCLSCHDGTIGIGLLLNTPGRGTTYPTTAIDMIETAAGHLTVDDRLASTSPAYLGTDIRFPFTFGGGGGSHHAVSMRVNQAFIDAKTTQCQTCVSSQPIQYPPASSRVKLRYTDNLYPPATGTPGDGVQCRSCHDPHDNSDTTNRSCFLVAGSGCNTCPCPGTADLSELCNACHYTCYNPSCL